MHKFKIVRQSLQGQKQGGEQQEQHDMKISAHANGCPRYRVRARWTLRSAPHRHERKFVGACVCKVTLKHHCIS